MGASDFFILGAVFTLGAVALGVFGALAFTGEVDAKRIPE